MRMIVKVCKSGRIIAKVSSKYLTEYIEWIGESSSSTIHVMVAASSAYEWIVHIHERASMVEGIREWIWGMIIVLLLLLLVLLVMCISSNVSKPVVLRTALLVTQNFIRASNLCKDVSASLLFMR